ncbi:MAG: class I SAM-dependent methyltransferase, partial [Gammaproteobacteria bacterium]|nr:class I SAM-dependent methyltransferase [Gammaproteobacteria bacterium]
MNTKNGKIQYRDEYNNYWRSPNRIGSVSCNLEHVADKIVDTCGFGKLLDIGTGEGKLVSALLNRGVDAYGIDVADIVVERCNQRMCSDPSIISILLFNHDCHILSFEVSRKSLANSPSHVASQPLTIT